jgi:hypothetical protein
LKSEVKSSNRGSAVLSSDDLGKYIDRRFNIDCPRMVLRNSLNPARDVYEGPGSIYQTPEGDLAFKLYAGGPRVPTEVLFGRVSGPNALKAGEIIPRSEYSSLEATSMRGAVWRGEFILPDLNQGATDHGPVITGFLRELVNTTAESRTEGKSSHLSLVFAESFDFPANTPTTTKTLVRDKEIGFSGNWSRAIFEAAGLEFELERKAQTVALTAQSKNTALLGNLDLRVCEALEFTLSESHEWVVRVVFQGGETITTLRRFPKARAKRTPRPPIHCRTMDEATPDVWRLFAKYLEYVITCPDPQWHPLSYSTHAAVVGEEGSLDAGLLALPVAIEGALKVGFPSLGAPDRLLQEQIDAACKLICDSGLEPKFRKRVLGSFKQMGRPRAKDRLLALQRAGVTREGLVRAWDAIRHQAVHADRPDWTKIDELYREYQSALTLLNEIVFLIIGYTGRYTDYSTPDWPLRNFEKTIADVTAGASKPTAPPDAAPANGAN